MQAEAAPVSPEWALLAQESVGGCVTPASCLGHPESLPAPRRLRVMVSQVKIDDIMCSLAQRPLQSRGSMCFSN